MAVNISQILELCLADLECHFRQKFTDSQIIRLQKQIPDQHKVMLEFI